MATPTLIHKSFAAVETKVLDAAKGLVETVFSVTGNLDRQNDVIEPGAFSKALAAKGSVPVVYAHRWDDLNAVLGKTIAWRELMPGDPALPSNLQQKGYGGVKATVQFDQETPAGRLAFTHVKNKNITEWSFAFDIDDSGEKFEDGARHIKSIKEVFEVTLALIGANPDTTTMSLKSFSPRAVDRLTSAEDLVQKFLHELDSKAMEVPTLTGDEAIHNDSIQQVLSGIKALIAQEMAEDYSEFDCINRLSQIAIEFIAWVNSEAMEYEAVTLTFDDGTVVTGATTEFTPGAKSNDEAIFRAAEAAILREFPVSSPYVPDYNRPIEGDEEPEFNNFLTYPQQGVITRG